MRPRGNPASPGRQRGWIGIVVILVALAIVAILAKDALKGYGLGSSPKAATQAGTPGERARAPGAIGANDMDSAPTTPASALERARGVEDMVKQQAGERAARGDGTTN